MGDALIHLSGFKDDAEDFQKLIFSRRLFRTVMKLNVNVIIYSSQPDMSRFERNPDDNKFDPSLHFKSYISVSERSCCSSSSPIMLLS